MKEFCSKGHSLAEAGVYGNGACRECQKATSRENHHKRMDVKRSAGLAPGRGRWSKNGLCRNGRHVLAEVGTYDLAHGKRCKACAREIQAEQRLKRPQIYEKRRDARLLKLYGMSLDEYTAMFAAQHGLCAICQQPETAKDARSGRPFQITVDHDHKTGKVRALLCHRCNRGLGIFEDNLHLLRSVLDYLARFSSSG